MKTENAGKYTALPVYYTHATVLEVTFQWQAKIVGPDYKITRIDCTNRTFYTKGKRREIAWYSGKPGTEICFMDGARITPAQKAEIKKICGTDKETVYLHP